MKDDNTVPYDYHMERVRGLQVLLESYADQILVLEKQIKYLEDQLRDKNHEKRN